MTIAESKITTQGQVTVPAEVRRRLGLAPGSVLEWTEVDGAVVVRRAAKYSFADIHAVLFDTPPARSTPTEIDEGIRARARAKYARR